MEGTERGRNPDGAAPGSNCVDGRSIAVFIVAHPGYSLSEAILQRNLRRPVQYPTAEFITGQQSVDFAVLGPQTLAFLFYFQFLIHQASDQLGQLPYRNLPTRTKIYCPSDCLV